ncbi:MAG TPA: carboxypeptidase regulatory-like domain-containing protein [Pyrinomonadaceae bacterium]|nr:carboxypeptidase regulatory-like domain-containing protein [Pyrinomonadaceae bacterium]
MPVLFGPTSRRLAVSLACCLMFALALAPRAASAQTVVGRISGTVTDSAGASVPGATVTVTNAATNLVRTAVADADGFYTVTNLPVGTYVVAAESQGFKRAEQRGVALTADARLTVDVALEPGQVTETVQVSTALGETVNNTSGEVARVIDSQQVQNLALNGRNYIQLLSLIPGVAQTTDDQLELSTSLATNTQSINGNRGQMTNMTVDGGTNLQSGSNASQINNVGIDFIQEVKVQTANFSAEYGRNSGAQVNVVTRGGTNEFHGSAFEYLRNDKLDARNFFAPVRPTLRYNDFGFSFGGPIVKDKFFFFGGMEWKKIRRLANPVVRTVPTLAELNGDFSGRTGTLNVPTGYTGVNPATGATVAAGQPIPGRNLANLRLNGQPAGITADGRAIANVYREMIALATSYRNLPVGNNATFQQPNPFDWRQEIIRLDYRFNASHSVYGRYIHDSNELIDPFGTFINSQLPTIPSARSRPGTSYQVAYTWLVTPTFINEAKANVSIVSQHIPPASDFWKRETYGFQYAQLFPGGGVYGNSIPDTSITGFASFAGAARSLVSPTTDIMAGDNVTWVRGSHTLKAGALIYRNRIDQNGRTTYAGNVAFNTAGNTRTTGNALADALLGNFRTYSESSIDPVGFFRFTQTEAFVNDSWKVGPRLSLELGVRYQYGTPFYTQANNLANFDPRRYDPAQAVTVLANGTIDPTKGGNRLNGLVRAGNGVPPEELGRVPGGDSAFVLSVPAGAPRGLYNGHHYFMPRVGFAFSPFKDNKTAVRGGYGIYYDRVEGNLIFPSEGNPPYVTSSQFSNANLSNITSGSTTLAPFDTINAVDPNLDTPYTQSYSLSVQRELWWGFFAEAAYVGNLGRHLIRQPDINQASFDALRANAALPAAQRVDTNALRPYKGYSAIRMRLSDSTSNYHGMQLFAAKRTGRTRATLSYTWSKVLTDASGFNDNPEDAFNHDYNYGPASFDRRHIFAATYTYTLPTLNGSNGFLRAVFGGYEISGITRLQSGAYFTVVGNTSIGSRRADYVGGEVLLPNGERSQAAWVNRAAFANAPDTRRGTSGVGTVQGPGSQVWDFSFRRRIGLTEHLRLQLQADVFNAFNRTNFRDMEVNLANASFGTLTAAGPPRTIQLGMKFTF